MGEEMDGGDDIDALCELLDGPAGASSPRSDVDALLGALAPSGSGSETGRLADKTNQGRPASALSDRPSEVVEPDLPDPTIALPPDVVVTPFIVLARFSLKCEVDLKQVAFGIRNAEYNPRKHSSITIRLFFPRTTTLLRASGVCTISGQVTEDELKSSAKKVARLIQRCGYEHARLADYTLSSTLCQADLKFPVRLELLATKWRRNALYEPEFFCSCVFRTKQPRVTYLVSAGGKVGVGGCKKLDEAKEAFRRIYPVLCEFKK